MNEIADAFHEMYYNDLDRTWRNTFYKGVGILKSPLDLWVYHEIIWETKPEVIVECGTAHGGSALWLVDQMKLYTQPCVITLDIEAHLPHFPHRPVDPGITYVHGSSVDPAVVSDVHRMVNGRRAMVILDSAHVQDHVVAEMNAYSDLIPVGGYMIVEDGNVHGHPVLPTHAPGPFEAIHEWIPNNPNFEIDESKHKFYMTFNPDGYLRRTS